MSTTISRIRFNNFFLGLVILTSVFWSPAVFGVKLFEPVLVLWAVLTLLFFRAHGQIATKDRVVFLSAISFLLFYFFYALYIIFVNNPIMQSLNSAFVFIYQPGIWNLCYFAQMMLIIFYLYKIIRYKNDLKINIELVYFIILIQVVACIIQYFIGQQVTGADVGMSGTFIERGPLSAFLALMMILLIEKGVCVRLRWPFFALIIALLVWIKGARGILFFSLYLMFMFLEKTLKGRVKMVLFLVIPLLGLVVFVFYQYHVFAFLVSKFTAYLHYSADHQMEQGAVGRYAIFYIFPKIMRHYFFMGVGLGNYEFFRIMQPYMGAMRYVFPDYINNLYFENLMEFGVIGACIFMIYFIVLLRQIRILSVILTFLVYAACSVRNDFTFYILLGMMIVPDKAYCAYFPFLRKKRSGLVVCENLA